MNCKYCGNPISKGTTFCGKCGQRVVEEEFDSVEAQYVEPVYETPDQEKKRKKNATSILVMSIFSLLFLAIAGYMVANGVEVFIEALQDIEAGRRVDSGDIADAITFFLAAETFCKIKPPHSPFFTTPHGFCFAEKAR